jgi:hypothetical protein
MLQSLTGVVVGRPEEALMRERYTAMLDEAESVVGRARIIFESRRNHRLSTTQGEGEGDSARIEPTTATVNEIVEVEDTLAAEMERNEPSNDRDELEFSGMYS